MESFAVLADPARRRVLELLADGERPAGDVVDVLAVEHGLTQPAVSRHLRILRESGFATVRAEGARRLYALDPTGVDAAGAWLAGLRDQWARRLDALGTELARGRRDRRRTDEGTSDGGTDLRSSRLRSHHDR